MNSSQSQPSEWTGSIQIVRFLPPLTCYFVNCDEIWHRELARQLNLTQPAADRRRSPVANRNNIRFQTVGWSEFVRLTDDGGVPPGSLVVLDGQRGSRVDHPDIESNAQVLAKQFQVLHENGVLLALVGHWAPAERTAAQLAGVVAVVTDLNQCDRLADSIRRAASRKRSVLVEWREPFLNRIPWPA